MQQHRDRPHAREWPRPVALAPPDATFRGLEPVQAAHSPRAGVATQSSAAAVVATVESHDHTARTV